MKHDKLLRIQGAAWREAGLSLVELMVAITIGLLLTGALGALLVHMSSANREQFKSAQQIENGRFAIDLLTNDIRLAGYYGEFADLPSIGSYTAQPDPCDLTLYSTTNVTTSTANSPLAFYIQGYHASSLTAAASVPSSCQTWINSASIKAGSDIIVVRRLDTNALIDPPIATSNTPSITNTTNRPNPTRATPVSGELYAQTTPDELSIQTGAGVEISYPIGKTLASCSTDCASSPPDSERNAANVASTLCQKDYFYTKTVASGTSRCQAAAYIRQLHVHVYFVSPCRDGSGTNGKCTSADDTIPTLKRLELTASGGSKTMTLVPLVEGIEFLKVNYGLDTSSDGAVDSTVTAPSSISDWQNVVMVDIRLLARNSDATAGYTDSKSYDLGNSLTYTPSGTAATYKRHIFNQKIYLQNIGGRRES